jgi:hypothetical protein
MERSARAIPLYPRNVRRLPGPPVYPFLGRWQTTLVGGPQSTQPSWHVYTCWFRVTSFPFLFRFTWKWDFATPPHRHMDLRYTCPGSSSGLMAFNGSDGVPWPCHQPWYIYCHWLPNTWYKLHPSVELLRWTRQQWLHCDCVNMGRPVCESVCV